MYKRYCFLIILLFFMFSCSVKVDFTHKVPFEIKNTDGYFKTNVSVFITSEDIRGSLTESGYLEDDFESIIIDEAILKPATNSYSLILLDEFSLSASNIYQNMELYRNTYINEINENELSFDLDGDKLLEFYKNTPFSMIGSFEGDIFNNALLELTIIGTVTIRTL